MMPTNLNYKFSEISAALCKVLPINDSDSQDYPLKRDSPSRYNTLM